MPRFASLLDIIFFVMASIISQNPLYSDLNEAFVPFSMCAHDHIILQFVKDFLKIFYLYL